MSPHENANNHNIVKRSFTAEGTTCDSCVEIIKRQAMKVEGVKEVKFDLATETGYIIFNKEKTDLDTILSKIEEKGYTCYISEEKTAKSDKSDDYVNVSPALGWIFGIIGFLIAAFFLFSLIDKVPIPSITQNMGYGLLFIVGLLTGFHCIAMCGGFVVSYTAKDALEGRKSYASHVYYAVGKTISYTIIGAIFGLIGSLIAFTPTMRGIVGILAGLFLLLFGLKMLNIFPILRKIQFRTPKFIARFIGEESNKSSPFVIGLLNGLMIACGPLQAIYIMAAGTGSMLEGAKLLFIFGLGTLPVMIGFGIFASFISSKMTQKIMKFSGVVVILLGLIMLNNGMVLTGSGLDFSSISETLTTKQVANPTPNTNTNKAALPSDNVAILKEGYQEIRMTVDSKGFTPNKFVLKTGVPVKWIIDGKQLNGCNSGIIVNAYGLNFKVTQGLQTIEFTPDKAGTIKWSCWMGMIPGSFIVTDDLNSGTQTAATADTAPVGSSGMTCGGASGGGCGCGMMG